MDEQKRYLLDYFSMRFTSLMDNYVMAINGAFSLQGAQAIRLRSIRLKTPRILWLTHIIYSLKLLATLLSRLHQI